MNFDNLGQFISKFIRAMEIDDDIDCLSILALFSNERIKLLTM